MALRDVILATQADLRANADHAIATFSADSRQVEGLRSETKIRQFSLTVDEPPTLGGTDAGPNPVELVLAALATCQEITYRAYATALGIPLESVSVKLEGAARSARLLRGERRCPRRLQRSPRRGQSEKQRTCRRTRQTQGSGRRALPGPGYIARTAAGGYPIGNGASTPARLTWAKRGKVRMPGHSDCSIGHASSAILRFASGSAGFHANVGNRRTTSEYRS